VGVSGGIAGTLAAGATTTPKVVSAASSVTALRVVTPGGMSASQPSALRVTPVSSGVRSAGEYFIKCYYYYYYNYVVSCYINLHLSHPTFYQSIVII